MPIPAITAVTVNVREHNTGFQVSGQRTANEKGSIMTSRDPKLHRGHRERMKRQFRENGLESLNDHQKLELLLFYAVPQRDTNELAHTILDTFGGRLCDVFDAPYSELVKIKGLGEHAATFLKLIPQTASCYISSKQLCRNKSFAEGIDNICKYFEGVFLNINKEEVRAAAVTSELKLVREKKIADGTICSVGFSMRALLNFSVECGCDRLIIAHNHPQGTFIATANDVTATRDIVRSFKVFGIEIIDHIVVGRDGSQSLRSSYLAKSAWEDDIEFPGAIIE